MFAPCVGLEVLDKPLACEQIKMTGSVIEGDFGSMVGVCLSFELKVHVVS